jgi:hypothetical protein
VHLERERRDCGERTMRGMMKKIAGGREGVMIKG